jgi:hypothetical protein
MVYLIRENVSGNTDTNWTILVASIFVFIIGFILVVIGNEKREVATSELCNQ